MLDGILITIKALLTLLLISFLFSLSSPEISEAPEAPENIWFFILTFRIIILSMIALLWLKPKFSWIGIKIVISLFLLSMIWAILSEYLENTQNSQDLVGVGLILMFIFLLWANSLSNLFDSSKKY